MKLTDKEFKEVCQKIAEKTFNAIKKDILKELSHLEEKENKKIDINTTMNVILCSVGLISVNFINICKNLSGKDDIDEFVNIHMNTIKKMLVMQSPTKEEMN